MINKRNMDGIAAALIVLCLLGVSRASAAQGFRFDGSISREVLDTALVSGQHPQ